MSLEIPPPPPPQPLQWRRALRELRALLAAPDATEHAIDFMYALGSGSFERNFQRTAASASGRALLAERPSLLAALSDRTALARMPEGSLGYAYLAYLERNGFEPGGLLALQHRVQARWQREEGVPKLDPQRDWFHDRSILAHDLFHVLTDYGTDDVGEATLLAFSFGQFGGAAQALLTMGAALDCARSRGWGFLRYDFRAWQRGRRAASLVALPWEELLPLRLDTVRRLAGVEVPDEAHPEGILRGQVVSRAAH
ncbi:MAG TPA: Coq4 family protein [Myxococcota bacterium]|jgi:ubiquinone biosynthesis protein COQ4